MSIALYIIGTIISLLGILLIVPTLSRIAQASDPIMLLSAPFVMNGVWLFVFGTVLCALARIIHLLDRTPPGAASIDAEEADAKVVIRCPGCTQQLRIDRGRRGIISCPKCGSKFPAQQAVS
jgi:DNA-directed RNA polymerase subunit RPC12/RpoP